MHTTRTSQLRFIRRHLLMLLMAFGWLLFQSQVAIASHDCDLNVQGESAMIQHTDHMMAQMDLPTAHMMKAPLCDKHCVPDAMQKENGHSSVVALPVTHTLAVNVPNGDAPSLNVWCLTPPAAGPPATIRFCRFRE
nr:DUF2946 domain-containing protein [uncultured Enterobacter sp.]